MESPLHHFEVHTIIPIHIGGLDLSINNAVVAMWVGLVVIGSMFLLPTRKGLSLVPGKLQSVLEIAVEFIRNLVYEFIGEEEGRKVLRPLPGGVAFPLTSARSSTDVADAAFMHPLKNLGPAEAIPVARAVL